MIPGLPLLGILGLSLVLLSSQHKESAAVSKKVQAYYLVRINTASQPGQKDAIVSDLKDKGFTKTAQELAAYLSGAATLANVNTAMMVEFTDPASGQIMLSYFLRKLSTAGTPAEKQAILEEMQAFGFTASAGAVAAYIQGALPLTDVQKAMQAEFGA